jgi:two-component system, OmpR family, sensor histidine kinase VicK
MIELSTSLLSLAEKDIRLYFAYDLEDERFIYVNPAFESFFSLSLNELQLSTLVTMIHQDDIDYLKTCLKFLTPGSFDEDLEFRLTPPDRKEHTLKATIFFNNSLKTKNLLIGYLEDITNIKANSIYLAELNNRKNTILNILYHDLSAPFSNIKNLSSLLEKRRQILKEEDIQKIIASIEKNSMVGIQIINEFMKAEFTEAVGLGLSKTRVDIINKFQHFIHEIQHADNRSTYPIRLETSHVHLYAKIDESKFFQAINSLISNSLKFATEGGSITIRLQEQAHTVLIIVEDNGVGMADEFQTTLVDEFNNARKTGWDEEPSKGLGMSVIRTIITWHEGKIWVKSSANKRKIDYIEIPKSL